MDIHKPIEQVLKQMVSSVKNKSKGRQEPWSEGSLEGDFCFGGCQEQENEKTKLLTEIAIWESVLTSSKIEDYQGYINQFPNGSFVTVAKKMIDTLQNQASANLRQNQDSSKQSENEALLKQADALKQKELDRLEKEKREKDKVLAATEERLKIETQSRNNLEEQLRKARMESESLKSNSNSSSDQVPKKIFISPVF